jgi:enoyl-CoA hydratase/carnithine racemase
MMLQHIGRTRTGGIEVVTLKRPPVNALDLPLTEQLADVFTGIANDQSAQAVVLTADGASFCAGLKVSNASGFDE